MTDAAEAQRVSSPRDLPRFTRRKHRPSDCASLLRPSNTQTQTQTHTHTRAHTHTHTHKDLKYKKRKERKRKRERERKKSFDLINETEGGWQRCERAPCVNHRNINHRRGGRCGTLNFTGGVTEKERKAETLDRNVPTSSSSSSGCFQLSHLFSPLSPFNVLLLLIIYERVPLCHLREPIT